MSYLWILDPGHGGIVNGKYTTAPSKMCKHGDDWFYEGVFNREIVNLIADMCLEKDISYIKTVYDGRDIPLKDRVSSANTFWDHWKNGNGFMPIFISVHSNASVNGNATGWEVWTSKGETKSDRIASILFQKMKEQFPGMRMRSDFSDGDPDKESQFYVLSKTKCPAILTENFFFTTFSPDYMEILNTEDGKMKIAKAHINMILEVERNGIPKK